MTAFFVGVTLVVVLITILKVNPFLSLMAGAITVRSINTNGHMVDAVNEATQDLGMLMGNLALLIIMAAIVGQCMSESGAAERLVRSSLTALGEKRAAMGLLIGGYVLSIPVFFDTVFLLLIPIARTLSSHTGRSYVLYILAICTGALISHCLVPPTPGPLLMVEQLPELDIGWAMIGGVALGIVPALAGVAFASYLDRIRPIPPPPIKDNTPESESLLGKDDSQLPSLMEALLPIVLPIALIGGNSLINVIEFNKTPFLLKKVLDILGQKDIALTLATIAATWTAIRYSRWSTVDLQKRLEPSILNGGAIILITGAGGAFGKALSTVDISYFTQDFIGEQGQLSGISLLCLGWGISAILKLIQGSSTVAMVTATSVMGDFLDKSDMTCPVIFLYAAIGLGSIFGSWMNDSGFWVVAKMSGFSERETLSTWTVLLSVVSLAGLLEMILLTSLNSYFFIGA